jgi:hypothetical protein
MAERFGQALGSVDIVGDVTMSANFKPEYQFVVGSTQSARAFGLRSLARWRSRYDLWI